MIDPIDVLNSAKIEIPDSISGSLVPDGAGGYVLDIPTNWILPVVHYYLQPVLLLLLLILALLLVLICIRVIR